MGIFTNQVMDTMNGYSSPISVQEAEGYDDGVYSAQIAQIVGLQNDMAMVEAGIMSDMQACMMVNEGVNENEVMSFSEGAIGDMIGKIKEFFKKLWAKIKAIFNGFMARLEAKFGKNNKEFINKYKKEVIGKDLTDFEPSYRKKKNLDVIDFSNLEGKASKAKLHLTTDGWEDENYFKEHDEKFDMTDAKETFLGSLIKESNGSVTEKEFEKEAFDAAFEDEESQSVEISTVMNEMMSFKESRKTVKKNNDDLNKAISDIVKNLEKIQNTNYKLAPSKGGSDNATGVGSVAFGTYGKNKEDSKVHDKEVDIGKTDEDRNKNISSLQRAVGIVSRSASAVQSCVLKATAVSLKIQDFYNKQNRSLFAKAVAYKRKEESAIMEEAMAELAVWEADY